MQNMSTNAGLSPTGKRDKIKINNWNQVFVLKHSIDFIFNLE